MQIVLETALFCAVLVVPALIASSFKDESANTWFQQEESDFSAKHVSH